MKIVHCSQSDIGGGAAIAANRLHSGLRRIGIDSRMVVGRKVSDDEFVVSAEAPKSLSDRIRKRLRSKTIQADFEQYRATRPSYLDWFSDDRAPNPKALLNTLPAADIYNLHWIAGFLDYRTFFSKVGNRVPIVWTLHDMNQFTGGCHYAAGCSKFTGQCGACPALGSNNAHDLAADIFNRKLKAYKHLNPEMLQIVTPSSWLAGKARKSTLLGRFSVTTVPYGLDTQKFRPRDRSCAREVFEVPQDACLIMFSAQSLTNHRKGMDCLIEAMRQLSFDEEVCLLAVGGGKLPTDLPQRCLMPGELNNERILSFAYSAADIFVCPSREDNLPNVVLESLACGTPVVGFNAGGIPDMVRPGKTGLLAAPEDVRSLREAIETILRDKALQANMSRECRQVTLNEYTLERQASRYKQLYEELIESAQAREVASRHSRSLVVLN